MQRVISSPPIRRPEFLITARAVASGAIITDGCTAKVLRWTHDVGESTASNRMQAAARRSQASSVRPMYHQGQRGQRYDSTYGSHRTNSSDLRRGDPSGSRTAWWSAIRGRRRPLWWWGGGAFAAPHLAAPHIAAPHFYAPSFAPRLSTPHFSAPPISPHIAAPPVSPPRVLVPHAGRSTPIPFTTLAAAIRSAGAPAPITDHYRPNWAPAPCWEQCGRFQGPQIKLLMRLPFLESIGPARLKSCAIHSSRTGLS